MKIHQDSENKCTICNKCFKHRRICWKPLESEIYEVRFLTSHAKCRRVYNEYVEAKTNFEWKKFEYRNL